MEPYEIHQPDTRDSLERALNRIELCTFTIQQAHYEVETPSNPEHKADLLLAVEALALEALDLLTTARYMAWGNDPDEDEE